MFSITEQTARLQVTNRLEKHGPSNVPAMTLRLTFRAPNDILSEVDSTLKSSLYRRPHPGENDMADEADERMQDPSRSTRRLSSRASKRPRPTGWLTTHTASSSL
ncbi:hypothetical protein A7P25_19025 [Achromobacter xylosoxidans]|nr:hypothetical protein A7P25_19025 [Achromobacter xylosoxidans]